MLVNLLLYILDLSYCSGIIDVSALGAVHALDLSGCNGTVDDNDDSDDDIF
jgi:hypothetical protein